MQVKIDFINATISRLIFKDTSKQTICKAGLVTK